MNSIQWQRWDPFRELHREMERLIVSLDPFQSVRRAQAYPPMNVHDAGDRYLLSMRLPGMTPADIELTIAGETLTIRGERKRAGRDQRRQLSPARTADGPLGANNHASGAG